MSPIDQQVEQRRRALGDKTVPEGADRKWGLALSGGGIRSATFCFGLLRAFANKGLLSRFDLMSTVSGGGYIGAMLGRLFDRADSPEAARRIDAALGTGNTQWFIWWLRANGRYLIPRGAKDRTFAVAIFLRNLAAIHLELGLLALGLGIALACVDILGWWALDTAGHGTGVVFGLVRWLPSWLPVIWLLLPLVAAAGVVYAAAHWALTWVVKVPRWWLIWALVWLGWVVLAVLFLLFGQNDVQVGGDLRLALWCVSLGLLLSWLLGVPLALRYLGKVPDTVSAMLRTEAARSLLTKALANVFRIFALMMLLGVVDRFAWYMAFELSDVWSVGLVLGLTAAVLRAALPHLAQLKMAQGTGLGRQKLAPLFGYFLTFMLCTWWVSIVHKTVLGAMFTDRALVVDNSIATAALLALPITAYLLLTGRNFAFLNLSSLHSFYRARLVRSYLGASNASRFGQRDSLGSLDSIPPTLASQGISASVEDVWNDDDTALMDYSPQSAGGPLHLINVCVNQTRDPRGHLFNQDRQGLPLTVASGGFMQVSQDGWKPLTGSAALTLGAWMAISGAAIAPGLGGSTRGGIAALAMFAGLRLGYWWTKSERTNCKDGQPSPWLAKSRGVLSETFGVFKGTDSADCQQDWFLTDGGHFENTGAYALLAERAEVIVVADCGADPNYAFNDIENLVRKARIDLEADIYFQKPKKLTVDPAKAIKLGTFGSLNDLASSGSTACLAFARVVYHGERAGKGILVVVKPNLCAGLPVDLVNFKAQHPDFPQQPTADQFFSEAQWESYFQLGQFLGGQLDRPLLECLLANSDTYFEDDDCDALAVDKPEDAEQSGTAKPATAPTHGRLPARIGAAAAVTTTLGMGAAATVGVSVWQGIDSVRASWAKQTTDERGALKELTTLWASVPAPAEAKAKRDALPSVYGNLATALVRTADTLCPSGEAGWFVRSPLAGRIFLDTLKGCRDLNWEQRPPSCNVLIEAKNPALKGALPNCLAVDDDVINRAVPPPRYWAYDYSLQAHWAEMHPCDPQRKQLASDEDAHEAFYGGLSSRQTGAAPGRPLAVAGSSIDCNGEADAAPSLWQWRMATIQWMSDQMDSVVQRLKDRPVSPTPVAAPEPTSSASPASASSASVASAASAGSATPHTPAKPSRGPASVDIVPPKAASAIPTNKPPYRPGDVGPRAQPSATTGATASRPLGIVIKPASHPATSSASSAPAASAAASTPTMVNSAKLDVIVRTFKPPVVRTQICRGITVYMQIFGPEQRAEVRDYRDIWRLYGANVPPIDDVLSSARRAGRPSPITVKQTTVRYHDASGLACAKLLGVAVGKQNWQVEPLSVRLKPTPGVIEVWIAPAKAP